MNRTVYPINMRDRLTHGQEQDLKQVLNGKTTTDKKVTRKTRVKKEIRLMTPTTEQNGSTNQQTARITRSVFDLTKFDDVQLGKDVVLPNKPKSVTEALELLSNDTEKLLNVIYEGLCADAKETARAEMSGFKVIDDEGELGDEYNGKFADETKGKLINAAVLSIAKMQGYDKSKTPEQKKALKVKAMDFLRANPAMIESLQS